MGCSLILQPNEPAECSPAILDYGKVTVKQLFLPCCRVLDIRQYEAIRIEIVRLLKEERERRKLSKYTVCKRSGVSQSMLSLVERGLRNPTLELVLRIADGVGVKLPAIIKKAQANANRSRGK